MKVRKKIKRKTNKKKSTKKRIGYPCPVCGRPNKFRVKNPGVGCLDCLLREIF